MTHRVFPREVKGDYCIFMEGISVKGKEVSLTQNTSSKECEIFVEFPYGNVGNTVKIDGVKVQTCKTQLRKILKCNKVNVFSDPEEAVASMTLEEEKNDYNDHFRLLQDYPNERLRLLSIKKLLQETESDAPFDCIGKLVGSGTRNGHFFVNVNVENLLLSAIKWNSAMIDIPENSTYLLLHNVTLDRLGERSFIKLNENSIIFSKFLNMQVDGTVLMHLN